MNVIFQEYFSDSVHFQDGTFDLDTDDDSAPEEANNEVVAEVPVEFETSSDESVNEEEVVEQGSQPDEGEEEEQDETIEFEDFEEEEENMEGDAEYSD